MSAYYNEIDSKKAAWLRELIACGLIAPGDVDEQSILDIRPDDLRGYTQCHFFAGIGIWSYALRLAGWDDNRPAWTGSCPCPSFSVAGKGEGFDDPRHLWPAWLPLVSERRPPVVFGEQADGAIGHGWFDLVSTDLEASSYAVGAAVLGACSVGSPHRRQRLFFVADTDRGQREQCGWSEPAARHDERRISGLERSGCDGIVADDTRGGCREQRDAAQPGRGGHDDGRSEPRELGNAASAGREAEWGSSTLRSGDDDSASATSGMADADGRNASAEGLQRSREHGQQPQDAGSGAMAGTGRIVGHSIGDDYADVARRIADSARAQLGRLWRDADLVYCRDRSGPRWRPVRPGTFPLAHGASARVGRLRGYGDGINAQIAAEFVRAYMEATNA